MGGQPLVSVLMPVYNGEPYLRNAIDSILNQTYTNFEFIIINDGSTDNTEDIILNYNDPRIFYIKNQQNIRLIATLNKGLNMAKGKYIARIDADDEALETRLQQQVNYMEANPHVGLCGSRVTMCFDDGTETDVTYAQYDDEIRFKMLQDSPFAHPAVIIRKSVLVEHNLQYNAGYIHIEDYQLWFKLSLYSTLHNLNSILLKYRVHNAQISNVHRADQLTLNTKLLSEIFLHIIPSAKNNDFILLQRFFASNLHTQWQANSILRLSALLNELKENNIHNYCNTYVVEFIKIRFWDIVCLNTSQGLQVFKAYQNLNPVLKNNVLLISKIFFFVKCFIRKGH